MGDAPIQPSDLGLRTERNGKEGLVGGRISWSSYKDRMEATPTRWSIYLTDAIRPKVFHYTPALAHIPKNSTTNGQCVPRTRNPPLCSHSTIQLFCITGESISSSSSSKKVRLRSERAKKTAEVCHSAVCTCPVVCVLIFTPSQKKKCNIYSSVPVS
jgi:hypothetical protein